VRSSGWARLVAVVGLAVATLGCFEPRPERPRDRINRLRLSYRVSASWYENRKDAQGKPVLVMSLRCENQAKKGSGQFLKVVTMGLHIRYFDGSDKLKQPLTLDVSKVKPGTSVDLGEISVSGLEVGDGEQLALQMEVQPTDDEIVRYPEYHQLVTGAGPAK
jgi:hypothetical protein